MSKIRWDLVLGFGLLGMALVGFLCWNGYLLWKPRVDAVSGDTLIHLIFARNFAEGRFFEFNPGETSRALTALLWNGLMVLGGLVSGQVQNNEGFLWMSRWVSVGVTLFCGWYVYFLSRKLGAGVLAGAVGVVFALGSPITFYWTVANPMETSLALLLGLWLVQLVWWNLRGESQGVTGGVSLGVASVLIFLNRPEMLISGMVAFAVVFLRTGERRWKIALGFAATAGLCALGYLVFFWSVGLSPLPSANSARRIMMDASHVLPYLDLRISTDALILTAAYFPLPVGILILGVLGDGVLRRLAYFWLGTAALVVLFFTVYFLTTWQGRYLLPLLWMGVPLSAVGWTFLAERLGWRVPAIAAVGVFLCYAVGLHWALLRPLGGFAKAPAHRASPAPEFFNPGPDDRVVLCLEVQGAYFYRNLRFLSSEGLITPEALEARARGLTLLEFIIEQEPDLVGWVNAPLEDPDGIKKAIDVAGEVGADLEYPGLILRYAGWMAGTGPVWRVEKNFEF